MNISSILSDDKPDTVSTNTPGSPNGQPATNGYQQARNMNGMVHGDGSIGVPNGQNDQHLPLVGEQIELPPNPIADDKAYLGTIQDRLSRLSNIDSSIIHRSHGAVLSQDHRLATALRDARPQSLAENYLDRVVAEDGVVAGAGNHPTVLEGAPSNHHESWGPTREPSHEYISPEQVDARFDGAFHLRKPGISIDKLKPKTKRKGENDESTASKRRRAKDSSFSYAATDFDEDTGIEDQDDEDSTHPDSLGQPSSAAPESATDKKLAVKEQKSIAKQYDNTYVAIWKDLARKDGPKASRLLLLLLQTKAINLKKTAILAAREAKRWQLKNNKNQKDLTTKARRAMREMFNFWKRNERMERELKKKYEKELIDKAKREEEEREAKRQLRKLNFLITQTELYSHFIGKKIKTDEIEGADRDPTLSSAPASTGNYDLDTGNNVKTDFHAIDFDNEDEDALRRTAAANAQSALEATRSKAKAFDDPDTNHDEMNFQNPTLMGDINIEQPKLLKCQLKEYQLKGLNWLANLYDQGINGILADEMGLGKTVQSISVLAYLAEHHNIWGPFFVVTPSSTLHNWQQEIARFVPEFKVLPYWGNAKDRKILRKFWDRKLLRYGKDAPFHVLVTSYQLVVADAAYFQKMKWQYMILDEAQAIKSSQSSRWKTLLSFSCRNRLLLTGTPIQNSMQELWALLHFIMPSLFDSHDEFSEWFSKDIESHAQSNTQLNEQQLRRLHVILKPFMLRRIKKNVQSELGDKVEIDIFCDLTNRQKKYYQMLKSQISIRDILESASSSNDDSQSLMNLVMQFRKVCNHPDLFERADVKSPFLFGRFAETGSFLRESDLELQYSTESDLQFSIPKIVAEELLVPGENNFVGSKKKLLSMFNIYDPANSSEENYNWLRFVNTSPSDLNKMAKKGIIERAADFKEYTDINYEKENRLEYVYGKDFEPRQLKLLISNRYNNHALIDNSQNLKELYSIKSKVYEDIYANVMHRAASPIAISSPVSITCNSNSYLNQLQTNLFDSNMKSKIMPLSLNQELTLRKDEVPVPQYPKSNLLPPTLNKFFDYSSIQMPSMDRFITESGKLARLDQLLVDLKGDDHRVLIYFQMTKMMDLMEEYLTYRQHRYIRLDGSSKLEDRRDLVHDWQTKPEIFVFLLSTRAGGLGINLTAADTVIFYDSDWNPTIDSQAMDRAHRLGQTKQVTVYRLLARGTIEERMRNRAKQKEQVQQVVMEGKASKKEDSAKDKKKDVAFLLLGEGDELPSTGNTTDAETDRPKSSIKNLEDLYHEGEGEFSGAGTPAL